MDPVEYIEANGQLLACVVRARLSPEATTFVTPPALNLQLGFVVYPPGGEIPRHVHRPLERAITGTAEVLVVRTGRCEVDVYDAERALVATRELQSGDVLLLTGGGHGFRMVEPTVLLEIKQGPYGGVEEKERF